MLPSRLLAASSLALALGCAAAPPPIETAIPAASASKGPPPPPAGPRESAAARARIDAWEAKLPDRWEIERRGFVGRFSFVMAHDSTQRQGAIATENGLRTELPLRDIWKEQHDFDGDGRPDLVALVQSEEGEDEGRVIFEVLADRPEGIVSLPVEGIESAPYHHARWAEGSSAAIELGMNFQPTSSQIFEWNGKAFAPRDRPFLYLNSWSVAHAGGDAWRMVGLAHGKRFERTFDPGTLELISGEEADDLGDGPHFYLFLWIQGVMRGMSEEEMNTPTRELIALRLEDAGFRETNLPGDIDLSSRQDRDGDKTPEFEEPVFSVAVSSCTATAEDSCRPLWVGLKQLLAWSGDHFASDSPRLAPAYLAWAAEASNQLATLKDEDGCSIPRIELALQVYMGLRRGGREKKAARAEAEALLKGATTAQCGGFGSKSRPLAAITKEAFQKVDDTISPPPPRPRPKRGRGAGKRP